MDSLYDICFSGEILEAQDLDTVKHKLAALFKADEATVQKLFSGKTQTIKRNCDRQTALKYKKAIELAGAKPIIRAAARTESTAAAPAEAPRELTAAERIAALAGAPDVADSAPGKPTGPNTDDGDGGIDLAPIGSEVLRPEERLTPPSLNIDTSAIEIMEIGVDLSPPAAAQPPSPDTSHLSMGEVGDDIPTLPSSREALSPDISGIALSPENTDFSDCATPAATPPEFDLSGLNVAPSGADILEEAFRNKHDAEPPRTDHLELEHDGGSS